MDVEKNLLRLVALLAAIAGIGAIYEWKFTQDADLAELGVVKLKQEAMLEFNREQSRLNSEERARDAAARSVYDRLRSGEVRLEEVE